MSSSVAIAQHLQRMDVRLGESDINFLQSILQCLASSQSLQELAVSSSCLQVVTVHFPSQQHAMLASPHHACVSCIVSAAYTDNSRGNQGSRDLFIHLDM